MNSHAQKCVDALVTKISVKMCIHVIQDDDNGDDSEEENIENL